jgi:hypothetical protein
MKDEMGNHRHADQFGIVHRRFHVDCLRDRYELGAADAVTAR